MNTGMREHEDLPILDEIGRDLSVAFAREEQAAERRRRGRRLRRIGVATVAIFAVVPGSAVVATRYIWAPDPGVNAPGTPFEGSKPIQIAEGRTEFTSWRISAYAGPEGLCWQVAQFTADASAGSGVNCQGNKPKGLRIGPSLSPGAEETFWAGWAPPGTARVELTDPAGKRLPVRVVKAPPDRIERAELPPGLTFYVAAGPPLGDRIAPAERVVAFDSAGREIERFEPTR